MLSLESAVLKLLPDSKDLCGEGYVGQCCGTYADCCGNDAHEGCCVLLGGLSHAKDLELLAYPAMQKEKEEPSPALEMEENRSLMEKPATISGYLKIIKVNFEEMDERVCKVLKFLSTFGVEIIIQRTDMANLGLFYC